MAIDHLRIESDEDGFHLILEAEDATDVLRQWRFFDDRYRIDFPLAGAAAVELAEAVKPIQEWHREAEEVRAEYERHVQATEDPDHPDPEIARDRADLERKREKEDHA